MADNKDRNMKRLKDEQQVRQRAGVIFGTNDEYGAAHGVEEVIANSVDEAREGFGDLITIEFDKDGSVTVEDSGRGLPMDWNEEEKEWNWKLALCTLYASGKYDNAQYGNSTGLNGLGLTATQFASEYMDVWATYGGKTRYMHFEKGKPVGDMKIMAAIRQGTGTKIKYKPDVEVFPALRTKSLPANYFINIIRKQAMLQDGLTIRLKHFELPKEIEICYKGGIVEFIDVMTQKPLLNKPVKYESYEIGTDDEQLYPEKYKVDMKLAFTFSKETKFIEVYHNGSELFEATQNHTADALKEAFTQALTMYAKFNGKLSKNDRFLFRDLEPMLVAIGATSAPGNRTWFKNQTKGAINNPFIKRAFFDFIYNSVTNWLNTNKPTADKIVADVIANKQIREEYDKSMNNMIRKISKGVAFGNKPENFKDCESKSIIDREIYLVEGRSALGSVLTARDPKFQAIFPLRGKPINCLKEKLSKVLANDIIADLFRIFECGLEVKNEHIENLPEFDITKLKWNKIIICTDADVDGMHIRCLLITMFYVLAPSLLKSGKVFIAETPLFEISWKDETHFAFDENEKKKILTDLYSRGAKDSQITIQRSKGLGENDPEMMAVSTMNPLTRRLTQVEYPDNATNVSNYFNALLGDDLETRRIIIDEYFDQTESAE